ncbi:Rnf-Nqr domain containing protein [Pseudomonas putida]|jgi:electron transport complex protein RnfA|uniref:Rnf-Nqr domain containing protein n=1 Tax=Pseudomonas putida TaxID=303 RepID=UPI0020C341CB|nr:Rnf-Nqr domain containing protein [Pseudomonas putida]UTL82258.1 electron transporter RnfA [Pseudomonas putida]
MNDYVLILISAALVSHLFLQQQAASRLRVHVCGLACALSIMLAVTGGQLLEHLIVAPWQLQDLRMFLLLPWQGLLAWGIPQALARLRPEWPTQSLTWPILGNAMVLGLTLQVIGEQGKWLATLSWGVLAGLGFWLALELFDDLSQRSGHAQVPEALRGLPIALLGAGVMVMALSGLNGIFTQ